jgi:hypothetical protein
MGVIQTLKLKLMKAADRYELEFSLRSILWPFACELNGRKTSSGLRSFLRRMSSMSRLCVPRLRVTGSCRAGEHFASAMVFPIHAAILQQMSDDDVRNYPDISDILARKAEARRKRAGLSFAEKIKIIEAMRERAAPFRKARERWRAEKLRSPD